MYIDESGLEERIAKEHGWSLKSKKMYAKVGCYISKRTTLISGLCGKEVVGLATFNCNTTKDVFLAWLDTYLIPELKPNQVVVLDNASFHKDSLIAKKLEKAGCSLIYLPPYSPDLNPIEKYWAWFKRMVKKLKRNIDDMNEIIRQISLIQ